MFFASQLRALFRHLNFQKWSENGVFCNVLHILTWKCSSRHNFLALFRHLNFQKWSENGVLCNVLHILTWKCSSRHNCVHFFDISTSKSGPRTVCFAMSENGVVCNVLHILTWKCSSRHNCVHFFDISTSKSGPRTVCFAHFDLEMFFASQLRALFRHLNVQKWSENGVFCNVLHILTWKCSSRHNCVHFFDISTSKSGPRTVCFAMFCTF